MLNICVDLVVVVVVVVLVATYRAESGEYNI